MNAIRCPVQKRVGPNLEPREPLKKRVGRNLDVVQLQGNPCERTSGGCPPEGNPPPRKKFV